MSVDADGKTIQEEEDATELQFPKGMHSWNPPFYKEGGFCFLNYPKVGVSDICHKKRRDGKIGCALKNAGITYFHPY